MPAAAPYRTGGGAAAHPQGAYRAACGSSTTPVPGGTRCANAVRSAASSSKPATADGEGPRLALEQDRDVSENPSKKGRLARQYAREASLFHITNTRFWEAALLPIAVVVVVSFSSCMDFWIGQFISLSCWYSANFFSMGYGVQVLHPQLNSQDLVRSPFGGASALWTWSAGLAVLEMTVYHAVGAPRVAQALGTTIFGICACIWLHMLIAPWRCIPPSWRPHKVVRYVAEHRLLEIPTMPLWSVSSGAGLAGDENEVRTVRRVLRGRTVEVQRGDSSGTCAGHAALLVASYALLIMWSITAPTFAPALAGPPPGGPGIDATATTRVPSPPVRLGNPPHRRRLSASTNSLQPRPGSSEQQSLSSAPPTTPPTPSMVVVPPLPQPDRGTAPARRAGVEPPPAASEPLTPGAAAALLVPVVSAALPPSETSPGSEEGGTTPGPAQTAPVSRPPIAEESLAVATVPHPLAAPALASPPEQRTSEVILRIVRATGLRNADLDSSSDPYCLCKQRGRPRQQWRTPVAYDSLDPVWNYEGVLAECAPGPIVVDCEVWDQDPFPKRHESLGRAIFRLSRKECREGGFKAELLLSKPKKAGRGLRYGASKLVVQVIRRALAVPAANSSNSEANITTMEKAAAVVQSEGDNDTQAVLPEVAGAAAAQPQEPKQPGGLAPAAAAASALPAANASGAGAAAASADEPGKAASPAAASAATQAPTPLAAAEQEPRASDDLGQPATAPPEEAAAGSGEALVPESPSPEQQHHQGSRAAVTTEPRGEEQHLATAAHQSASATATPMLAMAAEGGGATGGQQPSSPAAAARAIARAWGGMLLVGACILAMLLLVDYGKEFEFSMPYLMLYNIVCLRVPDVLGHSVISAFGDVSLYTSPATATTMISFGYMFSMQAYLFILQWVCQCMSSQHLFPRFQFVAQMYYYLFWYMMLMVISPGGVEDRNFWLMVAMLNGQNILSNIGVLQQFFSTLRCRSPPPDPPLKVLFDSKMSVQDQLADVVSLLIVPAIATSFHICTSLSVVEYPRGALISLWQRFGVLLVARLLTGLLTEEIFRRRVDLLYKADVMELELLPLDASPNRLRYLNDLCVGPKLGLESMRNIERCELYFAAVAVSCTFAVFQHSSIPTRYAFITFGS